MKRLLFILVVVVAISGALSAQDDASEQEGAENGSAAVRGMIDNFDNASRELKLRLLRSVQEQGREEMGPLYRNALQYVITNSNTVGSDIALQDIARLAVEGIVETGYSPAGREIWQLFRNYPDTQARVQLLEALAAVDIEEQRMLPTVNDWIAARHSVKRAGSTIDERVLIAALRTLGAYGDSSSFNLILEAILLQYSANVTAVAETALMEIEGEMARLATQAIRTRDAAEKLSALDYFLSADEVNEEQKSRIALAAMRNALNTDPVDAPAQEALRQLRYTAASQLRQAGYSDATDAMIEHFNRTYRGYAQGRIRKTWVLEAIAGLGAMGTEEAAGRLAEFLDLINTVTENDRAFDTQIILAVIRNLNELGYPTAYNALFYVTLLDYPSTVQEAAQEAMSSLAR